MIKFIDERMEKIVDDQDCKIDALESRHLSRILEFKQALTDFENRSRQMFSQNLQIKESMEIERAHAKKERADSFKERAKSRELIKEILEKDKLPMVAVAATGDKSTKQTSRNDSFVQTELSSVVRFRESTNQQSTSEQGPENNLQQSSNFINFKLESTKMTNGGVSSSQQQQQMQMQDQAKINGSKGSRSRNQDIKFDNSTQLQIEELQQSMNRSLCLTTTNN